ncbi:MAG: hypothetical protein U0805_13835 [Pirellulales bacterium]
MPTSLVRFCAFAVLIGSAAMAAESPSKPNVASVVEFNTPEADAILESVKFFPADSPWNTKVNEWPVAKNSDTLIESIGADKPLRYNPDMSFIIVPSNQPKVAVEIDEMGEESDKGPYPVPVNTPIEGWPVYYERENQEMTLEKLQDRSTEVDSDRHAIVLDPVNNKLYEFFKFGKVDGKWVAAQASVFDLSSNKLRPAGWTSADAAGLPILPAVVRYDELARGKIEHPLRVTVSKTRKAHVYPATHDASEHEDANLPRMGERLRLKKDFDTSNFSPEVETILVAMQEYGVFVADNGIDWAISVAPDARIPSLHDELRKIKGENFEFVTPPQGYKKPR